MLDTVLREIPELYLLCHSAYSGISLLCFGPHIIESAEGVQQGDPPGPLLFCLTLQPILQMLSSRFRVGFFDDVCFGGSSLTAKSDLDVLITECNKIGLTLNVGKCEALYNSDSGGIELFPGFKPVAPHDATLLGSHF